MKKITKAMALLLCIVLVFALSACGMSDEEIEKNLEGKWVSDELELADYFNKSMEEGSNEDNEVANYLKVDEFKVKIAFEFKDGTMAIKYEADSFNTAVEKLRKPFTKAMKKYMTEQLESIAKQTGMSLDDYLKATNSTDVIDFIDKSGQPFDSMINAILDDIKSVSGGTLNTASYKVEGGTVKCTYSGGETNEYKYNGKSDTVKIATSEWGVVKASRVK